MKPNVAVLLYLSILIFLAGCSNPRDLSQSVVIAAPLDEVWEYNGNDGNAKNWSVFFAKIIPCPVKDCPQNKIFKPGEVGSIRRCFRNNNEKGVYWDEVTIESEKKATSAHRKILTHNINGYSLNSLKTKAEFVVEQTFTALSPQKTKLEFSVKLQEPSKLRVNNDELKKNDSSSWDNLAIKISFKLGEERTLEILMKNLENIKYAVELKNQYIRKHPYSKFCDVKNFWCSEMIADY